jgi:FkbM family methyltransferase
VHGFDPTPASVAWVKRQELPENFVMHEVGLADDDGVLEVRLPKKEGRFNCSSHAARDTRDEVARVPVARLATLARRLGHDRIDVLKMDIEGGEMTALPDVLGEVESGRLDVRQLLVEFHFNWPTIGLPSTVTLINRVRAAGFELFHISPRGFEMSFIRRVA